MCKRLLCFCFLVFFIANAASSQTKLLVSVNNTQFSNSTGMPLYIDSVVYEYNSALRISSITNWKYENLSVWSPKRRTTNYEYDSNGNLLANTTQVNDIVLGWQNTKRTTSTYNTDDQILTAIFENWTGGAWVQDYQRTWTYNTEGYLMLVETDNTQMIYTYNMQNKVSQVLAKAKENGIWVNDYRYTYEYLGGNSYDYLLVSASWDNNMWVDVSRLTATYSANGVQIGGYDEKLYGASWDPFFRDTITLDINENPLERLSQSWDVDHWADLSIVAYTYDNQSNPLTLSFLNWNLLEWKLYSFNQYHYADFVSTQQPQAVDFSISPNPAAHFVQIKGTNLNKASLYDASGSMVLSQKMAGQEVVQFPVAHLPAGTYQLQVFDQTGRVGVKSVVIGL